MVRSVDVAGHFTRLYALFCNRKSTARERQGNKRDEMKDMKNGTQRKGVTVNSNEQRRNLSVSRL